jgi:hypothetical protein
VARQYLQDGPYIDPPLTDPLSADVATTAVAMWSGAQFTPIFANDPKAGKIYVVEASGLITTAATGTLTITPGLGTTAPGTTMGASIAQTVPASSLSGVWFLKLIIVIRTIGAPGGANSTCMAGGFYQSGGVAATANSGLNLALGGTSCAFDVGANNFVTIQKTLSVAGSFTTRWAFIYSLN